MKYIKQVDEDNTKLNRNQIIVYLFLIFLTGAFIGWCYEEIFYYIQDGKLVNRGFLYGPYLPVYGWGSLLILLTKRWKKNPIILFISIMILTGVLEYLTGVIMFDIWHKRWWDYTGLFLNIQGYVCLRSIVSFAIGGVVLIYLVEPLIKRKLLSTKIRTANIICIILLGLYLIDNILSFNIRN